MGRAEGDAESRRGFPLFRETSLIRAVIWMEAAAAAFMAASLGLSGWGQSQVDAFNLAFVGALTVMFFLGLLLFTANNMRPGKRAALVLIQILAGCLLVSYSAMIYGSWGSNGPVFLLMAFVGTMLAVSGVGALVMRERQSSRLAGYYLLWLFGMLLMYFMPLHELGLNYSDRDMLVGQFGLGISLLGATSFVIEKRMAVRMEGWITAGDAKYIAGKFDEAVEYYEQVLYIEPKIAKVWANSGSAFLRLGMWVKAAECFDRALELEPGLAIAHSGRGLALTYLKRYSEALESHDLAIRFDGGAVSWNNRGNTVMRMGGPVGNAIECYANAIRADPKYEIAWFNKGKAELMNEDVPGAIASLTRAVELKPQFAEAWFQRGKALSMAGARDQEALYCLDTALELNPTNSEAWVERKILLTSMKVVKPKPIPLVNIPRGGSVFGPAARNRPLLEEVAPVAKPGAALAVADGAKSGEDAVRMATEGDYSGAIGALDARLAVAPDDVVTLMTKGILLSRVERFDQALEAFESAIRLKPEWVGPLFSKGMILAARGDYDAAYMTMHKVTAMRPNYADAWSVKGIILGTQKKYAEAIGCFDRVIELDPANADAWRSKITALNKLGRYEEALQCYEKLTPLSQDIEQARRFLQEEQVKLEDARTLFRQGVELAKSKLYDEGLALLGQAIELRPNYVDALYISGVVNGVKGSYADAMTRFERVLELRPDHVEALYGKANILLKLGSHAKALELLERVLELAGDHVDAWCDRGIALARLGKQSDALACYDRVLKLAGDHPQAIAQRERCVKAMRDAIETEKAPV